MSGKLAARLRAVEQALRERKPEALWVDLYDNQVRVDLPPSQGKQMTFGSVLECLQWTEQRIAGAQVTGIGCIKDISQIVEGIPKHCWDVVPENYRIVVANLRGHSSNLVDLFWKTWLITTKSIHDHDILQEMLVADIFASL